MGDLGLQTRGYEPAQKLPKRIASGVAGPGNVAQGVVRRVTTPFVPQSVPPPCTPLLMGGRPRAQASFVEGLRRSRIGPFQSCCNSNPTRKRGGAGGFSRASLTGYDDIAPVLQDYWNGS
jgi:hypothetical protein